jgi:hypothetical protein
MQPSIQTPLDPLMTTRLRRVVVFAACLIGACTVRPFMDTKGLTPAADLPSTVVVETHIMPSTAKMGGIGETGVPPMARP